MSYDRTTLRRIPDVDPPTEVIELPRASLTPTRDRIHRALRRRPARGWVAQRLVAVFAVATAWEVETCMSRPRRAVARSAIRTSEWLLGIPAGSTMEALAEMRARDEAFR